MNEIPFKQGDTISNEYVLGLVFVIGILAVVIIFVLKLLKQRGIVSFKEQSNKRINVLEKKYLSASTQAYIVEVDGKQYLLAESSKNINMTALTKSKTNDCNSQQAIELKGTN